MCIREPCPNCNADYDACYPECPECGHPDGGLGMIMPDWNTIEVETVTKEVPCKICKKTHIVTKFKPIVELTDGSIE